MSTLDLDRTRWSTLVGRCARVTGDRWDAEDAVQDAALAVLRRLPALDPATDLDAYLWVAARRAAVRAATRRADRTRRAAGVTVEAADLRASVEDAVARNELRAEVSAALAQIPARQRTALLLFDVAGLDGREVGDHLGLDANAVNQLVFRARRSLRRHVAVASG